MFAVDADECSDAVEARRLDNLPTPRSRASQSGGAPNPLVWSAGARPNRRGIVEAVMEFAWLLGPEALWSGEWKSWLALGVAADDVRVWLFSVGSLVKLVAFLSSLHWLSEIRDLGFGGISKHKLLILNEKSSGARLVPWRSVPTFWTPGRQISVSVAPVDPCADTSLLCQHPAGMMMRALRFFSWRNWAVHSWAC